METLAWIGFTQSFFGVLLVMAKRNNHISDKILSVWLAISGITFMEIAITQANSFSIVPVNALITNALLFIYSISLTRENFRLKTKHWAHALLPTVFILVIIWTGAELRMEHYFFEDVFLPYRIVMAVTLIASFLFYWFLSVRTIHRYRQKLKNEFSSIEANIKLGWLLFVLIFYIVYNLILIAAGFIEVFSGIETNYLYFVLSFNLFLVLSFTFYGLRQQVLIVPNEHKHETGHYAASRLADEEKLAIKTRLLSYFEKHEPYLDGNLTVSDLAEKLGIQRHKLTEVLNTELNMNFYRFVNTYRVEKVKKLLIDANNNNFSIEALGYDCGFNSKTTFFTVFKNMTGCTPAQYRNRYPNKNI